MTVSKEFILVFEQNSNKTIAMASGNGFDFPNLLDMAGVNFIIQYFCGIMDASVVFLW